jgi:hypothetical protein
VAVGQKVEEFIAETFGREGEANGWRNLPTTDKQHDLLLKGNVFDIPAKRGDASDRINELLASGALCDWLSLAELESFDSRAGGRGKTERRFCCPLCGTDKRIDHAHRSLSVNTHTGVYFCHRCQTEGKLREFCEAPAQIPTRVFLKNEPEKKPTNDNWRKWVTSAKPIAGTPGAVYLESRGIPTAAAEAAGVKFGTWWRWNDDAEKVEPFDAVIFPIRNPDGELVAATARAIVGATKNTRGEKSAGVFCATPDALDAKVIAITEGPADALALAACGLAAVALVGTSFGDWLLDTLAGRDVLPATDADAAGDQCAAKFQDALAGRAVVLRLRPESAKDWAELAEKQGLDAVRAQLAGLFGDGEE